MVFALAVGLSACSKPTQTAPSATSTATGIVGYVRMTDLVKHHPLYSQLSGYDESIAALNLRSLVPQVAKPDAAIVKEETALQAELQTAAARTRGLLAHKSQQYQLREQQAIAAALHAPAGSAPSAAAIVAQINATARGQVAGVAAQANRDFDSYRKTLIAQDNGELAAAQKTVAGRAQRQYRARQDELAANEAALSLALANKHAVQRLSLRTRLSSLALDDTQRDDVRNALAALDRSDADALAELKNRDAQTLVTLAGQLRTSVQRDMQARANEIHGRSLVKLRTREDQIRKQFSGGPALTAQLPAGNGAPAAATLSPQLRATIATLHSNYQKQFNSDAKSTIDDFNRTRQDLRRRYEELRGIDTAAQSGANAQISALTRKRADLYGQMVAQIGREVRLLAQQRGIGVVVTDPVANAGGVDLTADAMKDIESLHE